MFQATIRGHSGLESTNDTKILEGEELIGVFGQIINTLWSNDSFNLSSEVSVLSKSKAVIFQGTIRQVIIIWEALKKELCFVANKPIHPFLL